MMHVPYRMHSIHQSIQSFPVRCYYFCLFFFILHSHVNWLFCAKSAMMCSRKCCRIRWRRRCIVVQQTKQLPSMHHSPDDPFHPTLPKTHYLLELPMAFMDGCNSLEWTDYVLPNDDGWWVTWRRGGKGGCENSKWQNSSDKIAHQATSIASRSTQHCADSVDDEMTCEWRLWCVGKARIILMGLVEKHQHWTAAAAACWLLVGGQSFTHSQVSQSISFSGPSWHLSIHSLSYPFPLH